MEMESLQSEELTRAVAAQDDFDLAYHLQLQEALSVSCYLNPCQEAKQQEDTEDTGAPAPPSSPPDDRALALALQNEELYWSQMQEQDRLLMTHKMEQLQVEIKQRAYDATFAQSLMDMDDSEWESTGDVIQNPFNPHSASSSACAMDSAFFCKLYVTVASSENSSIFAMGAAILDSQNTIVTELKKSFAPDTNKTSADYMALLSGLQTIHAMGFQHVEAHTDSIPLYNQVTNRWRVRNCKIEGLWLQVMDCVHNLPSFHMFLEPRNMNQHATQLAREAVSGVRNEGALSQGSKSGSQQQCSICLEMKLQTEMLKTSGCAHEFCNMCIVQHAEVKIQSGEVPVCCPQFGCTTMLSLDQCQSILSQRWFDLLKKRLLEASIPEAERVYCPYPHCSALMDQRGFGAPATSSSDSAMCRECIECARFFCVECRVPWHFSMSCSYYQKLPPDLRDAQDAKLHQLAENQKWQRCKKCGRMIELSEGCYHMTCRCGYEFCYVCGKEWKGKAATCKCRLWDEDYLLHQPAPIVNNDVDDHVVDNFDTDSHDDMEFDDVYGRSNFLFVSNPLHPLYKTKLCRYWARREGCFAGERCNFAHGTNELRLI